MIFRSLFVKEVISLSLNIKVAFRATCCGSPVVPIYSPKLRDNGSLEIVQTGTRNLQSEIESHAASVDINNIMRRYQLGDLSVLSKTQGFYGDFMAVPKTYAEVLQSVIDGRNFFDQLPSDIRSEFGNDFNRFYSSVGSDEWYKALSGLVSKPEPIVEQPDSGAESKSE